MAVISKEFSARQKEYFKTIPVEHSLFSEIAPACNSLLKNHELEYPVILTAQKTLKVLSSLINLPKGNKALTEIKIRNEHNIDKQLAEPELLSLKNIKDIILEMAISSGFLNEITDCELVHTLRGRNKFHSINFDPENLAVIPHQIRRLFPEIYEKVIEDSYIQIDTGLDEKNTPSFVLIGFDSHGNLMDVLIGSNTEILDTYNISSRAQNWSGEFSLSSNFFPFKVLGTELTSED